MATFHNAEDNTIITGTSDDDNIYNYSPTAVTIEASDGDDFIDSHGKFCLLLGGDGNDHIDNYVSPEDASEGDYSTILSGAGDDYIDNHGRYVYIDAGDGNDDIRNYAGAYFEDEAEHSTLHGGDGDDYVDNHGDYAYIDLGAGNDEILNISSDTTIEGGEGDDAISLGGGSVRLEYNDGDGDDTIYGFSNERAMLAFADGLSTSSMQSGNDVIISVEGASTGTITLKDVDIYIPTIGNVNANVNLSSYDDSSGYFVVDGSSVEDTDAFYTASFTTSTVGTDIVVGSVTADHAYVATDGARQYININDDGWSVTAGDGDDSIENSGDTVTINAGDGNDTIYSSGDDVTINAGDGDDSIENSGDTVTINAGDGDDYIYNNEGENVTINAGDGNDYIDNDYGSNYVSIEAGAGNDYIHNDGLYSTINAGAGDDSIINHRAHASINAGDGHDFIYNWGSYETINAGAGNDTIYNQNADYASVNADVGDDVISINGGSARLEYNDGDGHDTIYGFSNETATLAFADGLSTSSMQSGNDVIITVEGASIGTVTLKDVSAESNDFTVALAKSSYTIPAVDSLTGSRDENYVLLLGAAPAHTMQSPDGGEFSIWLNGWDGISHDDDINIVDASKFNGNSTIVGNALENVLVGSNGDNSLWGGEGSENDTLCGGDGFNEFFYLKGNGNDVINNARDGDLINLLNINLDDIDADSLLEGIDAGSITLKFNDGGSIRVNSSSDVNFRLADGSTWQAVERDSYTRHWDVK